MNAQARMEIQIANTMINSLERLYGPYSHNSFVHEVIKFLEDHIEHIKGTSDES